MPLRFSSSATKFRMRKCDWTALIVLNLQARNEVNITNLQSNMSERHYLSDEMVSTQMKTCSSGTRTKTSLNSVQRRYNRLKIKVAEQALSAFRAKSYIMKLKHLKLKKIIVQLI